MNELEKLAVTPDLLRKKQTVGFSEKFKDMSFCRFSRAFRRVLSRISPLECSLSRKRNADSCFCLQSRHRIDRQVLHSADPHLRTGMISRVVIPLRSLILNGIAEKDIWHSVSGSDRVTCARTVCLSNCALHVCSLHAVYFVVSAVCATYETIKAYITNGKNS